MQIAAAAFRRLQDGTRHHALRAGHNRTVWLPKHLVQAVGHENEPLRIQIMEEAVIISIHRVAVPIPEHHVQREKGEKTVQIEQRLESTEPLIWIFFHYCRRQGFDLGLVVGMFATIDSEGFVHIGSVATVVEVSLGVFEIAAEELFVPTFRQDVEAEFAPIEFDQRIIGARHGHARFVEKFAAKFVADVRGILCGVIERNL